MAPMKRKSVSQDRRFAKTFSIARLARRWRTTRKTIRRLLGQRQVNFVEIEGQLRVPKKEVLRYERMHGRRPP